MAKRIYLVNPACDSPSYYTPDIYRAMGAGSTIAMADLATTTVAAMAPADFDIRICDEYATPVDFEAACDFVGITGKVSQWGRMKDIAREFRRRGVTVMIGGPFASLTPDTVRPHCDILVRGEIEDIADTLFSDLRAGTWKTEYVGNRPDLATSPVPRWDLYPNDQALSGAVQTSRGCPFECEFCDVIEYLGRKQRHKTIGQVIRELDELYRYGYRNVFFADDNFTVYRRRAKELLDALRTWNTTRPHGPMYFSTQVSIDASGDAELLRMLADAGFVAVFIGIESPNEESLRSAKKRQNLKRNLSQEVRRFVEHGVAVDGGMIVGFDEDSPDIFARQYEFAMSTPIPIFTIGALVAPPATPLYARLAAEDRLVVDVATIAGAPWNTNIVPRRMTRQQLCDGLEWLCNSIYRPDAFEHRVLQFIELLGTRHEPWLTKHRRSDEHVRPIELATLEMASRVDELGAAEARMASSVLQKLSSNPAAVPHVMGSLMIYLQIRWMFERLRFKGAA